MTLLYYRDKSLVFDKTGKDVKLTFRLGLFTLYFFLLLVLVGRLLSISLTLY